MNGIDDLKLSPPNAWQMWVIVVPIAQWNETLCVSTQVANLIWCA